MKNNIIQTLIMNYKKLFLDLLQRSKHKIPHYMMFLTGTILLSMYIYLRFLRNRLPKEIPFSLTFYGFMILLTVCITYLYIIKNIIKPRKENALLYFLLQYVTKPIKYIVTSLKVFDRRIKTNVIIKPYYTKLVEMVIPIILDFGNNERIMLAYCLMLIPGYISLLILMVDVFYLNRIEIFYYFLFLNILPLLYTYFKYCLNDIKENYFMQLEAKYDHVTIYDEKMYLYADKFNKLNPNSIYHEKEVSIRKYFDIQYKLRDEYLWMEYPEYDEEDPDTYEIKYFGYPTGKVEYLEQCEKDHKEFTSEERHEFLYGEFYLMEPKLLSLMRYIDYNQYTHDEAYIKELRILLYTLYFVTWIYILLKSIHTLPIDSFAWLIPKEENPFE